MIYVKASTLNDFYNTNIYSIFPVAKHIHSLNIDKRLKDKDQKLVNDIALVNLNGKFISFCSFATKYCSHHDPINYPIYDIYVEKILMEFNKRDRFQYFRKVDLKDFQRFKSIIIDCKHYYILEEYYLKDIDRFLWQLGKNLYPRKYQY